MQTKKGWFTCFFAVLACNVSNYVINCVSNVVMNHLSEEVFHSGKVMAIVQGCDHFATIF